MLVVFAEIMAMMAYKLFRVRSNGTIGSLFIDKHMVVPLNRMMVAQAHPTPGFTFRKGFHCCPKPHLPHLSTKGRKWYVVEMYGVSILRRHKRFGAIWYIAQKMTVLHPVIRDKATARQAMLA
jgi:hypothetical protein